MDYTLPDSVQLSEGDESFIRELLDLPSRLKKGDSSSSNQLTGDDEKFLQQFLELPSNDKLLTYLKDKLSTSDDAPRLIDHQDGQKLNSDGSSSVNSTAPLFKKTVLHKFIEYHMNITNGDYSSVTLEDILNLVIKHGTDGMVNLWQMPEKRPAEKDKTSQKKEEEIHLEGGPSSARVNAVTDILFSSMGHEQFPELSKEDLEGVIPL